MTTNTPTDKGNTDSNELEIATPAPIDNSDDGYVPDAEVDPIIAEMRAAEAEIAAGLDGQGNTPDPQQPQQTQDKAPVMIPKPRFDEVRSERDLLRDQVGYLRGMVDAKATPAAPAATAAAPAAAVTAETPAPGVAKVDDIDAQIDAAEQKKLELAEKYDNGEISTVEMTKGQMAIDKEVRELAKQRLQQVRDETKNDTKAVLTAAQQAEWVTDQALAVQQQHPNVGLIDAHPDKQVIWGNIQAQAAQNLAKKGIDARLADSDPRIKVALIAEKAALTDRYTPEMISTLYGNFGPGFDATKYQKPVAGGQPGQKKPSEAAINRGAKIDLANSQPPSIADMGQGASTGDLTDAQIEAMTEDQVADLLTKAPNLLKRITG